MSILDIFKRPSTESATRDKGADGIGFNAAKDSRLRRTSAVMAGLIASADRHLSKHNLGKLRELCRMYDRQSPMFSGVLNRGLDNIFGSTFDLIPNTGDCDLNRIAKAYIQKRMEKHNCDATGVRNFEQMARTAMRAIWNDGDQLLVYRPDGSLMAFEADQIESPGSTKNGNRVVLGVEMNDNNAQLAYWVRQRNSKGDFGGSDAQGHKRVVRNNALLPAYRTRVNQTRGVPYLAAVLAFFERTNNYLDYESLAAEINAMMGWKIKKEATEDDPGGSISNEDSSSNGTFDQLQKMEPGMIFDLLVGEDIEMISSERPGDNFESYITICCRIIGVGIGMPLELVMLDFSKTNYSSARASLNEARRTFRYWQKFGKEEICEPWYKWQIGRGIATGELPARPELFKMNVQWPAWEYIDPQKEFAANLIAIKSAQKTISECIRERGRDPQEHFAEFAEDMKMLADQGISLPELTVGVVVKPEDEKEDDKK